MCGLSLLTHNSIVQMVQFGEETTELCIFFPPVNYTLKECIGSTTHYHACVLIYNVNKNYIIVVD